MLNEAIIDKIYVYISSVIKILRKVQLAYDYKKTAENFYKIHFIY